MLDPTYLFAPCSFAHFPCALPTFLVLVHNRHSLNTCPVCPHFAGFTPDVSFVGHLCQMKFTFFQVQLKCPLSGNPSQSSPSKISLVPSELPQPSSYTSIPASAACCTLCFCVCLTHPWADWGRPMSNALCWHRVYLRGRCPAMFIDWVNEITGLA